MKIGSEDRKKLILAGSLGVLAVGALLYQLVGGSSDTPSAAPAPVVTVRPATPNPVGTARVSRTALDPTLHPEGMLATESLVYSGTGRNIFAANSEPIMRRIVIEKPIAPVRTEPIAQPVNTGPPPPPPIDLRFFGIAQRPNQHRQAFFLKGDDVFLASEGDIVSRRYKVGIINATSVQVTDLTNNNSQLLPLMVQ